MCVNSIMVKSGREREFLITTELDRIFLSHKIFFMFTGTCIILIAE